MKFPNKEKRSVNFIFNRKITYYTKQTMKLFKILIIALAIIVAIMFMKFKPAYAVSINGEEIGYIKNENKFQEKIDENILKTSDENVAFVELDDVEYKLSFVSKNQINEETVLAKLEDNAQNVYKVYEIADLNNEESTVYVETMEEAEEIVESLKEQYKMLEPELVINTIYTKSLDEESIKVAKETIENNLEQKLEEQGKTVNGVYLACKPVSGVITSRFGAVESIRDHKHLGIDIGAPAGTAIKATASGKVTTAGWNNGGYGNLIIIDHGNGVQTYYGHCSKIYVTAGSEVKAGDVIGAVGSTGNSTGNHLHFEIRQNGKQVNPQKYVYK